MTDDDLLGLPPGTLPPLPATRRKSKSQAAAPTLPPSHLDRLRDEGFEVVSWLAKAVPVDLPSVCPADEGRQRQEWLPRLAVAPGSNGGFRVLEWLPKGHFANAYGFDGWQPSDGRENGGMHADIHGALGWFAWIIKARFGALSSANPSVSAKSKAPSIDEVLTLAGYTADSSDKPYAGKRVYRDGTLVGTFHVQTIWTLPDMIDTLRSIDPAEADAVEASMKSAPS